MKKFLWMAGGILVVSAAFFIPGQSGGIWPSVWWSSLAAGGYLLLMVIFWVPQVTSKSRRWIVGGTLVVLAVCATASLVLWQYMSNWQRALLPEIRTTIEKGTAMRLISQPLVRTLGDYYRPEPAGSQADMDLLFRKRYGTSIADDNRLEFGKFDENYTLQLYLAHSDADSLVIVGESEYIEGRDHLFRNHSGKTGLYQVLGILTKEGVHYVRVN